MIKKKFKIIINIFLELLNKTILGRYIHRQLLNGAMNNFKYVQHNNNKLRFIVPNTLNEYRIDSFSSKEPETLDWIDKFRNNTVFWDVGANIGLYSCYAAKARNCQVIAFEPSVFNLELLSRNINANQLENLISIFSLPLTNINGISTMTMSTTEWGGALSTFGQNFGQDGLPFQKVFSYKSFGITMDNFAQIFNLPMPKYLKMDVDGIEHLILNNSKSVLKKVDSVLIELNDDFIEQSEGCKKLLSDAGLTFLGKWQGENLACTQLNNSYNQIWVRN